MKKIEFLIDWRNNPKGTIVNYDEDGAKEFVKLGYAKFVNEEEHKTIKKQKSDKYYKYFKAFIHYPSYNDVVNERTEYSDEQLKKINSILSYSENKEKALEEIKTVIEYLSKEKFSYSYELFLFGFENSILEERKKEVRKIERLPLDNYVSNVKILWGERPFFYDKTKIFWVWNKEEFFWEMVDETDILILIDKELGFAGQLATGKIKNNYLEAFRQVGRQNIPLSNEKTWIQFKNQIIDIKNNLIFEATPKYFSTNPIPQNVGILEETPTIDNLFRQWVGKKYVQTLYEILAYSCLSDYPIHLLFCFIGSGRNGKSQFQKLVQKFFGINNTCSTELDLLIDNRFESTKLFKKLVCSLGETNFEIMSKTSLLKKLTGGDLIGFEFKNKMPFDDYNYAKIIINSNSLPTSLDTSDGFYRRWLIVDFPNEFDETGFDIIDTIPENEYSNLAKKILKILPELMARGKFTNQGTVEERKQRFIMASNPLPYFIDNYCIKDFSGESYIRSSELYMAFTKYLGINKKRIISKKEFNKALLEEGFEARRTDKNINGLFIRDWYIDFLKINPELWDGKCLKVLSEIKDSAQCLKVLSRGFGDSTLSPLSPLSPLHSLLFSHGENELGNAGESGESGEQLKNIYLSSQSIFSIPTPLKNQNPVVFFADGNIQLGVDVLSTEKNNNSTEGKKMAYCKIMEDLPLNLDEITEEIIDTPEPILPNRDIKKDIFQYLDSKIDIVNIELLKLDLKIDDETIESLKRDGLIYEPKAGFIQKL